MEEKFETDHLARIQVVAQLFFSRAHRRMEPRRMSHSVTAECSPSPSIWMLMNEAGLP